MIKKFLMFLLTIFLFSANVSAASICSYEEQATLNQKAANIKVKYDVVEDLKGVDDLNYVEYYFNIFITNVTEEFYVVVKNDYNNEEKTYYSNDAVDGIITIKWENIHDVTNFTVLVYTSDNSSCPDEKYKTIYLTTPRYNTFSDLDICSENMDFTYCQKYVTFAEIDENEFFEKIAGYFSQKENSDDKSSNDTENPTFFDKIFNFVDEYKLFFIGGIVIVVAGIIVIYQIRTKKQRKLGL